MNRQETTTRYRTVMFQSRTAHPTNAQTSRFGSEHSDTRRSGRPFFRWLSDPARPARTLPLPSGTGREPFTRLHFWTVDPLGLREYVAHHLWPRRKTSWFTLLYWQQLLDDYKPEPWAPAIPHFDIDLREPVRV